MIDIFTFWLLSDIVKVGFSLFNNYFIFIMVVHAQLKTEKESCMMLWFQSYFQEIFQ